MKLILLIFKIVFRYLFVFGCAGSSLLCGLCSALQLWCTGLLQWLLLLQSPGLRQLGFGSCGSRVLEHRLRIVAQGLSRSIVCGIFPDQGLSPCLLHLQVDSLPLRYQFSSVQSLSRVHLFVTP